MIHIIQKKIVSYLNQRNRYFLFKRRFQEIQHFLRRGSYCYDLKNGLIVHDEILKNTDRKSDFKQLQKLFSKNKQYKKIGTVKHISQSATAFNGSFVLFSNKLPNEEQYGELKVFNLIDAKVLSLCNTIGSYQSKLKNTAIFSAYFKVPKIMITNEETGIIVEELIDFHKAEPFEFNNVSHDLIASYTTFFKNSTPREASVCSHFEILSTSLDKTNRETIEYISSHVKFDQLPQNLPVYFQHGDLSLSNILIDEKGLIFLIDFEHANHYGFLYDVMWFWQNEAINQNDFSILESYLKGIFDSDLVKLFNAVSLKYDPSLKLSYILLVVLELIQKRVIKDLPHVNHPFLNIKVKMAVEKIIKLSKSKNLIPQV
jgi:thiamine kinase-like enzyme